MGFCTEDKEMTGFMKARCCISCKKVSGKLIEPKSPKTSKRTRDAYEAAHKEAVESRK